MLEIQAQVWSIEKGIVKQIKIGNETYDIKLTKPFEEDIIKKAEEKIRRIIPGKVEPLGKIIGKYDTIHIYKNIYDTVNGMMKQGSNRGEIAEVIGRRFKPNNKPDSNKAFVSCYMRFIKGIKPGRKAVPDRGEVVGNLYGNNIYKKPLEEVKQYIDKKSWSWMKKNIIRKYYPNYQKQSLGAIASCYKKFALGQQGIRKKTSKKYNKFYNAPEGAVARSNSYVVWIMPDDINKVKRAINHVGLNYKPTMDNIINQTGLASNRVKGTIDVLKEQKKIKAVYTDSGSLIYQWKE